MLLCNEYRVELIDGIQELPELGFTQHGILKAELINDRPDLIDQLWGSYQKAIEDYDIDPDTALKDALADILGIPVETWEKKPVGTARLVTLYRVRQDGFDYEAWHDDFIILFPDDIQTDPASIKTYAVKALRNAAHELLQGADAPAIIKRSCSDFNWGDFVTELDENAQEATGVYIPETFIVKFGQDVPIDIRNHPTITVYQDECLLGYAVSCTVTVQTKSGKETFTASCDQKTGAITLEKEIREPDRVDADSISVTFSGSSTEHPAAPNEDSPKRDMTYFYLDESAGLEKEV